MKWNILTWGRGGGRGAGRGYLFACHCSMVAFTELCIDLYWLIWKISPTNGCHVFMLIKLVLVLFVKVQLLTILDSGHMLHRNRLLKFLTQAYMENLPRPWRPCKKHFCQIISKSGRGFWHKDFLRFCHVVATQLKFCLDSISLKYFQSLPPKKHFFEVW